MIRKYVRNLYRFFKFFRNRYLFHVFFGYLDISSELEPAVPLQIAKKIYMYEGTNIYGKDSKFIISSHGEEGKFIMKKNSGSAHGLTVITGNHSITPQIGRWAKEAMPSHKDDIEKDVIVEEDVWIGANVTLLPGVVVGRGSIIGAGTVIRNSNPPYSIVVGNPAKIIGFKFTPEEVLLHEASLYAEDERLPLALLEKNYEKYFISRIKEIKSYLKISI